MRVGGKVNVLGVLIDSVDYEGSTREIITAARQRRPFAVTALAVHGVMTGVFDSRHRFRLNKLDLVTPDGQPVKWAVNLLHKKGLDDRVYGPTLALHVCAAAAERELPIFLYGSRREVLERMSANLQKRFPTLTIAGIEPSKFRTTTVEEKEEIAARIRSSGARIVFVGLGCPRQEVFAYEYRDALAMPILAIGAAFDYHSGSLREAPGWMQRAGLQWLYRLGQEPRRLWRRYLLLNPTYLVLLVLQRLGAWRPSPDNATAPESELCYG